MKTTGFDTHFTYTDQERDAESGFMYYGARYYHPVLGRFTQPDPVVRDNIGRKEFTLALVNPHLQNPYAYVANNPIKHVDTEGETPVLFALLLAPLAMTYVQQIMQMLPAIFENPQGAGQAVLTSASRTGDVIDAYELTTGKDFWNGEQIGTFGRFMTALGTAAPFIPARWFRQAGNQIASYLRQSQTVEWKEYVKHIPSQNVPWKKIVEGTTSGAAKYRPDINIEAIERYAWEHGTRVTKEGKNWKVIEFDEVMGASEGKEVRWTVVKESAGTIHGQPITYEQFKDYTK